MYKILGLFHDSLNTDSWILLISSSHRTSLSVCYYSASIDFAENGQNQEWSHVIMQPSLTRKRVISKFVLIFKTK